MPWDAAQPNMGFSTGAPWLPPGPAHGALAVAAQEADAASPLAYARAFLTARKALPALIEGDLALLDAPDPLVAFVRGGQVLCIFNLGTAPQEFPLPQDATELSIGTGGAALTGRRLSLPGSSAWFGRLQAL